MKLAVLAIILKAVLLCGAAFGAEDLDTWLKRQAAPQWYGVLVFTSRSCSVCPAQKQVLDSLTEYRTVHYVRRPGESKTAAFVIVDTDAEPAMAARYGVTVLPTFVVVPSNRRVEGLQGTPELKRLFAESVPR